MQSLCRNLCGSTWYRHQRAFRQQPVHRGRLCTLQRRRGNALLLGAAWRTRLTASKYWAWASHKGFSKGCPAESLKTVNDIATRQSYSNGLPSVLKIICAGNQIRSNLSGRRTLPRIITPAVIFMLAISTIVCCFVGFLTLNSRALPPQRPILGNRRFVRPSLLFFRYSTVLSWVVILYSTMRQKSTIMQQLCNRSTTCFNMSSWFF